MMDYLNIDRIAEISAGTYENYARKACPVSVTHFGRKFTYFLGRKLKRSNTCHLFFQQPDSGRHWMIQVLLVNGAVTEDLLNTFINRISDQLQYENISSSVPELP